MRFILPLLFLSLTYSPLSAQQTDTLHVELDVIQIEASRLAETEATAPFAVSVLVRSPEEIGVEPAVTLDEILSSVPGLWVSNRENFALGERLSVRGMGWRAGFGVRGVQVLLDGIPLTMPDGQSVLNIVDPSMVRRAEVIRGPASSFWGNGSGGVVFLSTEDPSPGPRLRARTFAGSHDLRKAEIEGGGRIGNHRLSGFVSHMQQDGYRDHGRTTLTRAGLHGNLLLGARSNLRFFAALLDEPLSQNPGPLTAQQSEANPRQVNPGYLATDARKISRQGQAGAALTQETGIGTLSATGYGLFRNLTNPLPFAYIEVDRLAGGSRLILQRHHTALRWGIGADLGYQRDDRQNWNNAQGQRGTMLRLNQVETVLNAAGFTHATVRRDPLSLSAGLRFDHLNFSASDFLLTDGDQSGSRRFSAWSPTLGATFALGRALLFANYNTALEAPTTTELVNRPDLAGGFNPDLRPQRTHGVELGMRGQVMQPAMRYEVALFSLYSRDRLIPFQTPDGGGRTFFRNQGATRHNGVELAIDWRVMPRLHLRSAYTWNDLVFMEDERLSGNQLPGIPPHRFSGDLRWTPARLMIGLSAETVSSYFADDNNTAQNDSYLVLDLQLGHRGIGVGGGAQIQPFVRVANLTDAYYHGSVNINAANGQFYEPAAGRSWQAGLNLSL